MKEHGYPNEDETNKFNDEVVAKIISECLDKRSLDMVKKMLAEFRGPVLLNSITPMDDIITSEFMLEFVKIYSEFGDASRCCMYGRAANLQRSYAEFK